jgi:outer membrane protein OmpA-like peptidoglycan-associated protein
MKKIRLVILGTLLLGFTFLFSPLAPAGETPTMVIEEAKFAIEEARKAGADRIALDDYQAAKSWLSQAEKDYDEAKSFLSRMSLEKTRKAKEEEIMYLGNMAKLKAMTAESKAKKNAVVLKLKEDQQDLTDYENAIVVLQNKLEEVRKAREVQAKAEAEMKQLETSKRQVAELEVQKKKELEEAQRQATLLAEQKKRELEDTQRKAAEFEALKRRELDEARLKEAQRALEREKELTEAKIKAEQMASLQAKEAAELKGREEKMAAERKQMEVLRQKAEALEHEKTMISEASKIPSTTVKTGEKEIVITIVAVNLFTPQNEVSPSGKGILDPLGKFLNGYPNYPVEVRGHTDSTGSAATNQAISDKRAQKVREYLVAYQNVQPTRVTAKGFGPSQPVASNATEAGRALNRRVEIAIRTAEK